MGGVLEGTARHRQGHAGAAQTVRQEGRGIVEQQACRAIELPRTGGTRGHGARRTAEANRAFVGDVGLAGGGITEGGREVQCARALFRDVVARLGGRTGDVDDAGPARHEGEEVGVSRQATREVERGAIGDADGGVPVGRNLAADRVGAGEGRQTNILVLARVSQPRIDDDVVRDADATGQGQGRVRGVVDREDGVRGDRRGIGDDQGALVDADAADDLLLHARVSDRARAGELASRAEDHRARARLDEARARGVPEREDRGRRERRALRDVEDVIGAEERDGAGGRERRGDAESGRLDRRAATDGGNHRTVEGQRIGRIAEAGVGGDGQRAARDGDVTREGIGTAEDETTRARLSQRARAADGAADREDAGVTGVGDRRTVDRDDAIARERDRAGTEVQVAGTREGEVTGPGLGRVGREGDRVSRRVVERGGEPIDGSARAEGERARAEGARAVDDEAAVGGDRDATRERIGAGEREDRAVARKRQRAEACEVAGKGRRDARRGVDRKGDRGRGGVRRGQRNRATGGAEAGEGERGHAGAEADGATRDREGAGGAEGSGVVEDQRAVGDSGRAAVGVGGTKDQLTVAGSGQGQRAGAADRASDREGGVRRGEGRAVAADHHAALGVQGEVCGRLERAASDIEVVRRGVRRDRAQVGVGGSRQGTTVEVDVTGEGIRAREDELARAGLDEVDCGAVVDDRDGDRQRARAILLNDDFLARIRSQGSAGVDGLDFVAVGADEEQATGVERERLATEVEGLTRLGRVDLERVRRQARGGRGGRAVDQQGVGGRGVGTVGDEGRVSREAADAGAGVRHGPIGATNRRPRAKDAVDVRVGDDEAVGRARRGARSNVEGRTDVTGEVSDREKEARGAVLAEDNLVAAGGDSEETRARDGLGVRDAGLAEEGQRATVQGHGTRAGQDICGVGREVERHSAGVDVQTAGEGVLARERERARTDLGDGAGAGDHAREGRVGVAGTDGGVAADGGDAARVGGQVAAQGDVSRTGDGTGDCAGVGGGEGRVSGTGQGAGSGAGIGGGERGVSRTREITGNCGRVRGGELGGGGANQVAARGGRVGGGKGDRGRACQGIRTGQVSRGRSAQGDEARTNRDDLGASSQRGAGDRHADHEACGRNHRDISRSGSSTSGIDDERRSGGNCGHLGARGDTRAGDRHADHEARGGRGEDDASAEVTDDGADRRSSDELGHLGARGDTGASDRHADLEARGGGREDQVRASVTDDGADGRSGRERGHLGARGDAGASDWHADLETRGGSGEDKVRTTVADDGRHGRGRDERGYLGARGDAGASDRHADEEARGRRGEDQARTAVTPKGSDGRDRTDDGSDARAGGNARSVDRLADGGGAEGRSEDSVGPAQSARGRQGSDGGVIAEDRTRHASQTTELEVGYIGRDRSRTVVDRKRPRTGRSGAAQNGAGSNRAGDGEATGEGVVARQSDRLGRAGADRARQVIVAGDLPRDGGRGAGIADGVAGPHEDDRTGDGAVHTQAAISFTRAASAAQELDRVVPGARPEIDRGVVLDANQGRTVEGSRACQVDLLLGIDDADVDETGEGRHRARDGAGVGRAVATRDIEVAGTGETLGVGIAGALVTADD